MVSCSGKVLQWLTSFLFDRTQVVAFAGLISTSQSLLCGVPQGSVLGPLLFVLYSADVIKIAAGHGVSIPTICRLCSARPADGNRSHIVISLIASWRVSPTSIPGCRRLKLNAEKTKVIWFGTRQLMAKVTVSPLQVEDQLITPLDKVLDLGVIIDGELSMDQHVRNIVRGCFYQLRQLRSVRQSTLDVLWLQSSLRLGLTIVTPFCTAHRHKSPAVCRWC